MPTSNDFSERRAGFSVLATLVWLSLPLGAASAAGDFSAVPAATPVELRLPDLDGRDRSLDEFRGKVVLVNFWASWCTPCITEMPGIQRLADTLRDRPFAVIGVNVAEAQLRVKAMVRRLGIAFPVLLDRDSAVFNRWGAGVLPTTYVLDGEGVVRYLGRGPLEWDGEEIAGPLRDLVDAQSTDAAGGPPGSGAR